MLFSLSTIFNIRLAAYGVYRLGSNGVIKVDNIISHSIRGDLLEQYRREHYLEDAFLKNYSQLCYTNPHACFFTEDLLDEEKYQNAGYTKLLRNSNIGHEALIGVNGSPGSLVHIIRVYKTIDSGDFTEREKELFQYIGRAFNHSKILFSKFFNQQRKLQSVSAYCDESSIGFAIVDSEGKLLQSNLAFMNFSAKLSSGLTKGEITKDIIFAVTGTDKLPEGNYFREEAHVDGINIIIQKKKVVLFMCAENLFFITLQKDKRERISDVNSVALSSRYGLTRRETDVVLLVAKGYNNQEISEELFIGLSTVKTHISNIYSKLTVNSRTELLMKLRSDAPETFIINQ